MTQAVVVVQGPHSSSEPIRPELPPVDPLELPLVDAAFVEPEELEVKTQPGHWQSPFTLSQVKEPQAPVAVVQALRLSQKPSVALQVAPVASSQQPEAQSVAEWQVPQIASPVEPEEDEVLAAVLAVPELLAVR